MPHTAPAGFHHGLTLEQARRIGDATLAKGRELGLAPLTVVVLDAAGQPKALLREDGCSLLRPEIATGKAFGAMAPVAMVSDWFYVEVTAEAGVSVPLDPAYEERAVYLVEGEVDIAGESFAAPQMLIFRPGDAITIKPVTKTRMMFLGGTALEGPRHIWWNFVSSRKERIEAAKEDWKTGRFGPVPDETEFIPLPDR